ncbi:MAG: hypothetical protein AB9869_11485 [Verrucomicrobiia bacterium]
MGKSQSGPSYGRLWPPQPDTDRPGVDERTIRRDERQAAADFPDLDCQSCRDLVKSGMHSKRDRLFDMIGKEDMTSFSGGLCHVFADELADENAARQHGLSLRRVCIMSTSCTYHPDGPTAAMHVFWQKGDRALDCQGWRPVGEILKIYPGNEIVECDRGLLFTPDPTRSRDSSHNCYDMLLDSDLVAAARRFARKKIDADPILFCLDGP